MSFFKYLGFVAIRGLFIGLFFTASGIEYSGMSILSLGLVFMISDFLHGKVQKAFQGE